MPPAKDQRRLVETNRLLLLESEGDGPFHPDGTVTCVIARPGRSKGFGKRVYPAPMLERDAGVFAGRPSFENHESPAAKKARGKIPRGPRELAGEIRESWWDGNYSEPDDAEHQREQGAVLGRLAPTKFTHDLIETCPNVLKISMKAFATGLKNGTYKGSPAEIVEGIDDDDQTSVDLVTQAGAGGRVLALVESGYDQTHEAEHALEDVEDDDLLAHLKAHRPHLLEAAPSPSPSGESVTEPASQPAPITLSDVVGSDEFKEAVSGLVESRVEERMGQERAAITADMVPRRQVELRDLHSRARTLIEESKLPDSFKEDLRLRYGLEEAADGSVSPRASLDVQPVFEGDGEERKVIKSSRAVLEEALAEDIKRERLKLAEARPTRVRGQGASGSGEGDGGDEPTTPKPRTGGWRDQLKRSGVDPERLAKMNSGRLED